MPAQRVAIVTGGATGMGHGVAVELASQGWKVVILDWNHEQGKRVAEDIDGDFFKVDVREWAHQFEAFEKVFDKYGRVDFVFGNAGRADVYDYLDYNEIMRLGADTPPNLEVLDINLLGASYTSLLAIRAFTRNPPDVDDFLLVLTSSGAGLYPAGVQPFYAAAKHGIIGLARSIAWRFRSDKLRSCALVPGLVPTPIMPKEIIDRTDAKYVTPVSHIVTAVNDMLNSRRTGTVCEASVDNLFYRDPPPYPDEAQRQVMEVICDSMLSDFKATRESK